MVVGAARVQVLLIAFTVLHSRSRSEGHLLWQSLRLQSTLARWTKCCSLLLDKLPSLRGRPGGLGHFVLGFHAWNLVIGEDICMLGTVLAPWRNWLERLPMSAVIIFLAVQEIVPFRTVFAPRGDRLERLAAAALFRVGANVEH